MSAANPLNSFLRLNRTPPARPAKPKADKPEDYNPSPPDPPQPEIDFDSPTAGLDGYDRFRKEREDWTRAEGRKHGLPLGKKVEVDLGLGRKAVGRLFIDETSQLLEPDARDPQLRVGNRVFRLSKVQSFIRLDDATEA